MRVISPIDPAVRKLREQGDQAFAAQKWERALELYLEALEKGPYDPRVGQRIADLYRRVGKTADAIEYYKEVVRHYSTEGFWAKAIAVSKMILVIDPSDREVRDHLAKLYSAGGKTPRAAPVSRPKEGTAPAAPPDTTTLGMPLDSASQVPLFSEMQPDELTSVLERLAVRSFPVGAYVCEEGDAGDRMYIISEGCVEVSVQAPEGTRLTLTHLRGGDFFGEYSLLTRAARNATVQAETDLELLEITLGDFDVIAAKHPRIWIVLEEYLRSRVLDTILSKSSVFRVLTPEERQQLVQLTAPRQVKAEEVIMGERTEGDEMYFIKSGKVSVTAEHGGSRIALGELGPGDYFGEIAMLTGKPRTATVKARTDCELFCLKRKDAAPVLRNNREILRLLRSKILERAQATIEAIESFREARLTLV